MAYFTLDLYHTFWISSNIKLKLKYWANYYPAYVTPYTTQSSSTSHLSQIHVYTSLTILPYAYSLEHMNLYYKFYQ